MGLSQINKVMWNKTKQILPYEKSPISFLTDAGEIIHGFYTNNQWMAGINLDDAVVISYIPEYWIAR